MPLLRCTTFKNRYRIEMELLGYIYFIVVMTLICGVVWFYVGLVIYQRCVGEEKERVRINDDDLVFLET